MEAGEPEDMREVTPTQSALLELREERRGMDEGYRFLDEKRLVLAAEALRQLACYEAAMEAFSQRFAQASDALQAAVARHGLEGLEVYPVLSTPEAELVVSERSVLGVSLQEARIEGGEPLPAFPASNPSPEAERCRKLFADLAVQAASLAGISGNLERLREEYQRTARRARALEDVLLPEIDETIAQLDLMLEDLDREEAVRVRYGRGPGRARLAKRETGE